MNAPCSYRMANMWARITDVPVKLFTDYILLFCEVKDALSLGCTNKFFALITTNETFRSEEHTSELQSPC